MAETFVSATSGSGFWGSDSNETLSMSMPSGLVSGNVLYAIGYAVCLTAGVGVSSWTAPSGWSIASQSNDTTDRGGSIVLLTRTVDGTEASSYNLVAHFSNGDTLYFAWAVLQYSGVDGSGPIDGTPGYTTVDTASTITAPSISPTGSADIQVAAFFCENSATFSGSPSGFTQRTTSSSRAPVVVYDKTLSSSGSTATVSQNLSSSFPGAGVTFTLTPSSASSASVTGVPADLTIAGVVGTVTAVSSSSVTGTPAALTIAGVAGSVSTETDATITGVPAQLTITGVAGTVSSDMGVSITGIPAVLTIRGVPGDASALEVPSFIGPSEYRYLISDASTGGVIAELPLADVTFSRVLSGCGTLSATLSVWHADCTRAVLGFDPASSDREITVVRHDVPIWNGPVTGIDAQMSQGTVQITAREASFYLQKRTLEVNKNYDGTDIFDAVRDLVTYMTTKTANGSDGMSDGANIIAALPRWSVNPASGDAGQAISDPSPPTFYGSARHLISDCMEGLAADPTTGFEWRMDYRSGSVRQSVHRTLTLGYPNLGEVLTTQLSEAVVADWGRTGDWERGATRVHALYAGGVKTKQSSAAAADGILLSEAVDDISDITKPGVANSYAVNLRRLRRPPVRTYQVAYTPSDNGLQFDFANLGDTIPLAFSTPDILAISNSRRVIQIDVTPSSGDAPEMVALTFNIPLDDLST